MFQDRISRMKVIQVFRKKNPSFYSIENVFRRVRDAADESVCFETISVPKFGVKFWNFHFLFKVAGSSSTAVFHITGDIHYGMLVMPPSRTILTIHDCVFVSQYSGFRRWLVKLLLLDLPVRRAKYITTISAKTKDEIIRLTGCEPSKIRVIGNPVSSSINFKERPFNKQCPVLLFIGVTSNKNLSRVIHALEGMSCKLRIVGKPENEAVAELDASGVPYEVVYNLTENELAEAYSNCDVVLFPSLYEGFGLPIIEGFQAGRVVLTSDLSPMREVAMNAACLVDPYDVRSIRGGLEKLIKEDGFRESLVRKGFSVAASYSAGAVAQKYLEIYKEVYSLTCAE